MKINTGDDYFIQYLASKGVILNNRLDERYFPGDISEWRVKEQIETINEFHKNAMGYKGYMNKNLKNDTGRLFEENKVHLKKFKRYLQKINRQNDLNEFEQLILQNGDYFIKLSDRSVEEIEGIDYISLILRSMKRIEVCAGCTGFDSLRRKSQIEIRTVEESSYDMVEVDIVKFITRLKRKGLDLDWKSLVKYYVDLAQLESESVRFILASCSFPNEFFRCVKRYNENKKSWSLEQYCKKLNECVISEGCSLI